MEKDTRDYCVRREAVTLLSEGRLILRETKRAITPFGGVAVFVAYLHKVGFGEKLRPCMPICWRSPNQIEPAATFTAFLIAVLVGRKTVCTRQLAARRSSFARLVRNGSLSHRRHDSQSVSAFHHRKRAALVR